MTTDLSTVPQIAQELRDSFNSGKTLSLEWRKGQLMAFGKMIKECGPKLAAALHADLHKGGFESMTMEIMGVGHECKLALENLKTWMSPQKVADSPSTFGGESYIYNDPLGVACIIGAWNYPVLLTLQPMVGAIAAGNCICVKVPSDKYSAATSQLIGEIVPKYLDQSCIRVVEGDRHATQAVLNERWDLLFFTGGSSVGTMVAEAAAKNLTPTVLELGGKSPTIVDKTADMEVAARRLTWGTFMNAGQTCIRPDYLMVHNDIADQFIDILKETTTKFYGAQPKESHSFGRLINERAHDRVSKLLEQDAAYVIQGCVKLQ